MKQWTARLGAIAAVLAIITFGLDLPEKISKLIPKDGGSAKEISQTLAGSIRGKGNRPLPGVLVSLPELKLKSVITDQNGYFMFTVNAPKQEEVALMAQKEGYQIYDTFASLGNTGLEFTMNAEE